MKKIFQEKTIQLTSSNPIKVNEVRNAETFVANGRKYRIFKGKHFITIERAYLDPFDLVGLEMHKFLISAISFFDSTEDATITTLRIQVKKGFKTAYIITTLLLLITTLYLDATFGSYFTFLIIFIDALCYLFLITALGVFHEELTNDIKQR